jgi:hypothetical protein
VRIRGTVSEVRILPVSATTYNIRLTGVAYAFGGSLNARGTTNKMPQDAFKNGYVAGWQSIRGADPVPDIPPYQVPAGQTPYLAGVALGVRDACAYIPAQRDKETSIGDWLDGALQRRRSD